MGVTVGVGNDLDSGDVLSVDVAVSIAVCSIAGVATFLFSRGHVTLHLAVSVRRSVGL